MLTKTIFHCIFCLVLCHHMVANSYRSHNHDWDTFPTTSLIKKGDLMIGGLFEIYNFPVGSPTQFCSRELNYYFITKALSLIYGIEMVNQNLSSTYNITLGYNIQPTCGVASTTLMQGINLQRAEPNLIAIIGAYSSAEASAVAPYYSFFYLPVLTPKANSYVFRNAIYQNLFRFLPDQDSFTQVLIKLIDHFKWSYVSMIYSNDFYNTHSANDLRRLLDTNNVCLGVELMIDALSSREELKDVKYKNLFKDLLAHSQQYPVTFLFLNKYQYVQLFQHIKALDPKPKLLFVTTDTWPDAHDLNKARVIDIALGSITLLGYSGRYDDFNQWSTVSANIGDSMAWLSYWQNFTNYNTNDSLDSSIPMTIDIVHLIANCIYTLIDDRCQIYRHTNNLTACIIKNSLIPYLSSVRFKGRTGLVAFLNGSGVMRTIDIANFVGIENISKTGRLVRVGSYNPWTNSLYIDHAFNWKNYTYTTFKNAPKSRCSDPCSPNQVALPTSKKCCWTCITCGSLEFKSNLVAKPCLPCPLYQKASPSQPNQCVAMAFKDIAQILPGFSVFVYSTTSIGFLALISIASIYVFNYNNMVFRLDVRLLLYYIFFGLLFGYVGLILFLTKPSNVRCACAQFFILLSFTLIFSAIAEKLLLTREKSHGIRWGTSSSREKKAKRHMLIFFAVQIIINLVVIVPGKGDYSLKVVQTTKNDYIIQKTCPMISNINYLLTIALFFQLLIILHSVHAFTVTSHLPVKSVETRYMRNSILICSIAYAIAVSGFFISDSPFIAMTLTMTVYIVILYTMMLTLMYCKLKAKYVEH